MEDATPVELEVIDTSTIHIAHEGMRLPALCFTVDDTEALVPIMLNTDPYPRFVITQVKPFGKNNEKAEVIFREQSAHERAVQEGNDEEAPQPFEVSEGTVASLFEGLVDSPYAQENSEEIDTVKESLSSVLENIPPGTTVEGIVELIRTELTSTGLDFKISSRLIDPETGEDIAQTEQYATESNYVETLQTYRIVLPLSTIDLAHHMWSTTDNSPAFILATESMLKDTRWYTDDAYMFSDFLAIAEFADMQTDEYNESIVEMMKAVSGKYLIQPTAAEFAKARATMLSLIFRLSKGEKEALKEACNFINAINRIQPETPELTERPLKENYLLYSMQQVMDTMYESTSPNNMFTLLDEAGAYEELENEIPEHEQFLSPDEMNKIDDLLQADDIQLSFKQIMEEEYSKKGVVLNNNPNEEDIYNFYSVEITENSFPESMKGLVPNINIPLLYERDWNGDFEPFQLTKTNAGMAFVSQMITLAVRYARVHELANKYNLPFSPVGVFVSTVSTENENAVWLVSEAMKGIVEEQPLLFKEVLLSRLPDTVQKRLIALTVEHPSVPIPMLLVSTAFVLLHNICHTVESLDLSPEIILSYISEDNSLNKLIRNVLEIDVDEDDDMDESHAETCYETLAVINYLTSDEISAEKIVDDMIEVLEALSIIVGLRDTDYEQGSLEWDNFVKQFYISIVNNAYDS